ncbi:MAG: TolC family protein [Pseudomonadota bacterium]
MTSPLPRIRPGARYRRAGPLLSLLFLSTLLAGCASLDTGPARLAVNQDVLRLSGHSPAGFSRPALPLAVPSAAEAARLSLANGPRVNAILAGLDQAEAEAVQAGLLRNPFLHATVLDPRDGPGRALDLGLSWDLAGLLSLGPRREAADQARAAARLEAVSGLLGLAVQSRAAWYAHLAHRESAVLLTDQAEAADLAARIAQRLEEAGNLPPLAAAGARAGQLETRFAQEDTAAVARASGERLAALLGVAHPDGLTLPEGIPRLPENDPPPPDPAALEKTNLALARLNAQLEQARRQSAALDRQSGLDSLELGWSWDREASGEWKDGPSLGLALPLFDTGQARRAAARFKSDELEARRSEARLALAREAREAHQRMTRARARVEALREELLPLLGEAGDQALLQYNAMQKSPFHLLDLKRRELEALGRLVAGLGDYWQARTALEALAMGVSLDAPAPAAAMPAMAAAPESGGH